MSVKVISALFDHSESRFSARLVLFVLADSGHDDGVTWISQVEIAAKARISLAEVKRSLIELEELGEIERRKVQRGRRRISVYRVMLPGVKEPMYDRLPFTVKEPFTTALYEPSSEIDDGSSGASTTAHLVDISQGASVNRILNRNSEPSLSKESVTDDESEGEVLEGEIVSDLPAGPPDLTLVGGRNLALDALVEVSEIGAVGGVSPRAQMAAVYLNGRKGTPGIRAIFYAEARDYAERAGADELARFAEIAVGEPFERALAEAIRKKAGRFRERMPDVTMGPKGLRDWWLDLAAHRTGRVTGDDIRRMATG